MNSKVMNKVLSFLLVAAVAFTSFTVPASAATVKTLDAKKIVSMDVYDGLTPIENRGEINMYLTETDGRILDVVFEDKNPDKAPKHKVKVSSNKSTVVNAKATFDKATKESYITLTLGKKAKAGTKATITVKSVPKPKKTVKFTVNIVEAPPVVEVTGVSLSTTAPKVGETITANPVPANADTTGLTYAWSTSASTDTTAEWTPLLGATTNTFKVTSAEVGKFIKVTVTDAAGKTYEAATTTAVEADASADVALVDDYGLQSDGTGIIGDKLTVTYGATFGTPTNVSWYKDGKVVATNTVGDDVNEGLSRTIDAANWGTGTYKVTITNTAGTMATTNEIVITDKEEAAVIKSFAIEDDYTQSTNVVMNTSDTNAVTTVKLSKNYDGIFRIYRDSDSGYGTLIESLRTSTVAPAGTAAQVASQAAAVGVVADGLSLLASNMPTNNQAINTTVAGFGIGYIENDGSVTYKFRLNGGVVRGSDYKITFDQDSISTDTPGTGKANVFETAANAPYVTKPANIVVTKVSNGNPPEITFQDEDGQTLGWLGRTGNATLLLNGFNACHVYSSTAKTNDSAATTVTELAGPTTGDQLLQGVWTAGGTATTTAYWFAYVSTSPGIYAKATETLKSEAVAVAQPAASDMDIIQNSDTASTARVSFSNLRADGTVYVVRGSFSTGAAVGTITNAHYTSAAQIYSKLKPTDGNTYVGSAQVAAGTEYVDIENAIGLPTTYSSNTAAGAAINSDYNTDDYIAVFIPEDENNYGMIYTDAGIGTTATTAATATVSYNSTVGTTAGNRCSLHVRSDVKTYILNGTTKNLVGGVEYENVSGTYTDNTSTAGTTAVTGNTISAKDQFGNEMSQARTVLFDDVTWRFTKKSSEGNAFDGVTLVVNWDGSTGTAGAAPYDAANTASTITIHDTNSTDIAIGGLAIGDEYTATTSTGQTLTLKATGASTVATGAGANDGAATWTLSIK